MSGVGLLLHSCTRSQHKVVDLFTLEVNPVDFQLFCRLVLEFEVDRLFAVDRFEARGLLGIQHLEATLDVVLISGDVNLTIEKVGEEEDSVLVWLALHRDDGHDLTRVTERPWMSRKGINMPRLRRLNVTVVGEDALVVNPVDLYLFGRQVVEAKWQAGAVAQGFDHALGKCVLR